MFLCTYKYKMSPTGHLNFSMAGQENEILSTSTYLPLGSSSSKTQKHFEWQWVSKFLQSSLQESIHLCGSTLFWNFLKEPVFPLPHNLLSLKSNPEVPEAELANRPLQTRTKQTGVSQELLLVSLKLQLLILNSNRHWMHQLAFPINGILQISWKFLIDASQYSVQYSHVYPPRENSIHLLSALGRHH